MLKTIVKKELLENIFSYRFPLFFLICAILIISSLYVHYLDYSKRMSDYNEQIRLARNELASSRVIDLHFGRIPLKGFLPPSPLSIFATGFETSLPKFYEFQADGFKPGDTSVGDESVLSVFGKFDFIFIVQMVISLIVLLFASDLIAGEKELGTLRSILSNSVPRHTLLMGKLWGGFTAVWLPFVLTFLLGIILLGIASFPLSNAGLLVRLIVIFASASLFILVYFALGLMISASTSRARTALVAILLVWIFFQLVIPKLSDMVASVVYPIRTETVVSMEKSLIVKTLEDEKAKLLGKQYETLFGKGYAYKADPEPASKRDEWNTYKTQLEQQVRERKSLQLRNLEEGYRREKRIQQTIAGNLSLISPSAAFTRFLTDVCGTGEIDKEKYLEAVKIHQRTLDTALYSHVNKTTVIMPSGSTASSSSIGELTDLKSLPSFTIRKASLSEVVAGNLGSLVSLAFWLIAPFAAAYVRFLKYDVR
jgi:ABC-type transport system involved in multi-copper enzyme maturation permease subunit